MAHEDEKAEALGVGAPALRRGDYVAIEQQATAVAGLDGKAALRKMFTLPLADGAVNAVTQDTLNKRRARRVRAKSSPERKTRDLSLR